MIDLILDEETIACNVALKVMGVGGGGCNAVCSMTLGTDFENVQFIVANTDLQALNQSAVSNKIQLGRQLTKGLGAGANPDVGRRAAEEDLDAISQCLVGTDLLFLTAGLGGGTGSGALPVIAKTAKDLGILTIAIVTKPFAFEGAKRKKHAAEALETLQSIVDTLIVVPNQKLVEIADPNISMLNAFALSNDILKHAIKGISDIITRAGHINVDFADVRAIMKDTGFAIMGTGIASGPDRASQAALQAISSPLLENASINGAKGILINITGSEKLELQEINKASTLIYEMVSQDANIILGSVIDNTMGDEISVTVIATGLCTEATQSVSSEKRQEAVAQATSMYEQKEERTSEDMINHLLTEADSSGQKDEHDEMDERILASTMTDQAFDENGDDLDTPTFMRKKDKNREQVISQ